MEFGNDCRCPTYVRERKACSYVINVLAEFAVGVPLTCAVAETAVCPQSSGGQPTSVCRTNMSLAVAWTRLAGLADRQGVYPCVYIPLRGASSCHLAQHLSLRTDHTTT